MVVMMMMCSGDYLYALSVKMDEKIKLEIEGEWGWLVGPNDVVISYLFGRPILLIHELV